ncbi:MAG: mobile mystery protein A [Alcaligenaceae bacterium]
MSRRFQNLQLQQMDAILTPWHREPMNPRPARGWARAIRDAVGMTAVAFARRLGMSPAGARKLEQAEANETITLTSLKKMAAALDCELRYALVPKQPLQQMIKSRALYLAQERIGPVAHSMSLENQSVKADINAVQLELLATEILDGPRRDLW